MTRPLFAACVLLSASTTLAQTPAPAQPAAAAPGTMPKTVTMSGCVGGQGSDAQPFMLNNAFVVPSGNPALPDQSGAAAAGAQPPTTPPAIPPAVSPALPPPASPTPPTPPPTAGAAGATSGTSGTAGAAGTAGTAGTPTAAGTTGVPSAAGAGAATAGAAAPGSVASGVAGAAMNGYRLSGSDMKPWAGQRVEIVGALVNPNPGAAAGTAATPEFRVQSVRPVGGPCPQ